jgi:DNA topoisomerase III
MPTVVLCEKPAQARAHAALFGIAESKQGYYTAKNGWIFTFSIGHMIEQMEPGKLDPKWESWSLETLPIVPEHWRFNAASGKAEQLKTVMGLLKSANEIIIATDCGREGELIGRELIDLSGNRNYKLLRFWASSLDEATIRAAWNNLRDGSEFDTLHKAALIRQRFDFMWGMTNSRGATLTLAPPKVVFPVGRVQTPVLNLVVMRHLAIVNFTPKVFFTLVAQVQTAVGSLQMTYEPKGDAHRLWDKAKADALAEQARGTKGPLKVSSTDHKQAPPKFPSLSDLQKEASRRWKWTLDHTLDMCQALYDAEYVSYPRTSCNIMPAEQIPDVPEILSSLEKAGWAPAFSVTGASAPIYRKDRIKPDAEIQKDFDHHAILPTKKVPGGLAGDQQKLYQLVVLYYLRAFAPDYEYNQVDASLDAGVLLKASGVTPLKLGYKALEAKAQAVESDEEGVEEGAEDAKGKPKLPPIKDGMQAQVERVDVKQGKTTPPPYYTEGTLLEDMISVHKFIANPDHRARLKETSGLGTEATRASIIKELRNRKLIVPGPSKGKIDCSDNAILLIQSLPEILKDPGQTAIWEDAMDHVRHKRLTFEDAMRAAVAAVHKCASIFQEMGVSPARAEQSVQVLEFNGHAANCPECSAPMSYMKNGKFGPYWACTKRPCKGNLKVAADGKPIPRAEMVKGDLCPKCGKKHLIMRQSARGAFWACSGFPKCKHTVNIETKG